MQSQQANGALAATWILGAGLIGLLGNVTSQWAVPQRFLALDWCLQCC